MSAIKRLMEDEIYKERDKLKNLNLTNIELVEKVCENTGIDFDIVWAYLGEH